MGGGAGSGGAMLPRTPLALTSAACTPLNCERDSHLPLPKRYPPVGLKNCGNTCYANAALQCLLSTALARALVEPKCIRAFKRYSSNAYLLDITRSQHTDDESTKQQQELKENNANNTPTAQSKQRMSETCRWLTKELTTLCKQYTADPKAANAQNTPTGFFAHFASFAQTSSTPGTVIDPGNITRNVTKISRCLQIGRQEDAHEFLRALLATLVMDGHNRQLSSLFDGLLESAVTCQSCGHVSITRDRYMDLSLEISSPEVKNLVDALGLFTKTEKLSDDNLVDCAKCEQRRKVSKGLRLATAPTILVCHLKRFAYDDYGRLSRLSKTVGFPLTLEIGDFMSRANRSTPPPYELVGVLVHQGQTCGSGHYLAYVKSGEDWYRASDSHILKVDVETVLEQKAYILMYEVQGMRNHRLKKTRSRRGGIGSFTGSTSTSFDELSYRSRSLEDTLSTSVTKNNMTYLESRYTQETSTDVRSSSICSLTNNCTFSSMLSSLSLCYVDQCLGTLVNSIANEKTNLELRNVYADAVVDDSRIHESGYTLENISLDNVDSREEKAKKILEKTILATTNTKRLTHTATNDLSEPSHSGDNNMHSLVVCNPSSQLTNESRDVAEHSSSHHHQHIQHSLLQSESSDSHTTWTTLTKTTLATSTCTSHLGRSSSSGHLRERGQMAAYAYRKRTPIRTTNNNTGMYDANGRRAKSLTRPIRRASPYDTRLMTEKLVFQASRPTSRLRFQRTAQTRPPLYTNDT